MRSGFIRRERLDAEGVNILFHHLAQRLVDHLMPLHGIFSLKLRRDDGDAEMSAAALGAAPAAAYVLADGRVL